MRFIPTRLHAPLDYIVGVALMVLLVPRLLPDRTPAGGALAEGGRDFTVSMQVEQGGEADGKSVSEAGLRQLQGVFLVEVERVADDLDAGVPDHVPSGELVPLGVHQVTAAEPKRGAVRQHLVEVYVGETRRLLGLVLRVHDEAWQSTDVPHEVGPHPHPLGLVEVVAVL